MKEKGASKFISLFLTVFLLFVGTYASAETLDAVRQAIKEKGKHWTARETVNFRVPAYRNGRRAGLVKPTATGKEKTVSLSAPATGLAVAFDWSAGGSLGTAQNYVTAARDQGDCGSCWAFATTGALESYTLILGGDSTCALGGTCDLSEQMLLTCSGAGNCASGGYIDNASDYIKNKGLPSEDCYGYDPEATACSPGSGWTSQLHTIDGWAYVATEKPTVATIKNALAATGPLVTTMDVYEDFYDYYSGGVYTYTSGAYVGSHAVLIVGYQDDDTRSDGGYFRVKNSWGTDWGEDGFFLIGYSELSGKVNFGQWTIAYQADSSSSELPEAPSNLTATAPTGTQVTLAWTDNATNEEGFKIERCSGKSCTSFAQIGTAGADSVQFTNSGLTAAMTYTYRVRAYNGAGDSDYSNTVTVTTPASTAVPAAPSNLSARAASRSQINLSWKDNATNETGFQLERCSGAGCTNFAPIGTLRPNVKTCKNIGLMRGTSYTYRLRAYNASGYSDYSNAVTAKTFP